MTVRSVLDTKGHQVISVSPDAKLSAAVKILSERRIGAVMVMSDLQRAMRSHVEMDWMAVSSYGAGTQSSGVVRILKDLNADLEGRHVRYRITSRRLDMLCCK